MGAADVVPGVSGGTIAFITGIYDELLSSINKLRPEALAVLFREGWFAFWHHVNGSFLLILGCGIFTSLFALSKTIGWVLVNHPIPIWSFFIGLVLVSIWHMLRQLPSINVFSMIIFVLGVGFAWWFSGMSPFQEANPDLLVFFVCGAIAVCAMILPGISGSSLLLLLGVYQPVLAAVSSLNVPVLVSLTSGCVVGLLAFSQILSWLLTNARTLVFSFLTGMMLGSINRLWPWKDIGVGKMTNILPQTYEQLTGESSQLLLACSAALVAIAIVLIIELVAHRSS